MRLCNKEAVEMSIDGGSSIVVQADKAPIVDGHSEERMRVGCGSAVTGIFAKQWFGLADEVVVVDEHITGIFTEHQAGRMLDARPSGIKIRGRKSTPGRYFQVAKPGLGWGGTDLKDPLEIVEKFDPKVAWPGLRLFMVMASCSGICTAPWSAKACSTLRTPTPSRPARSGVTSRRTRAAHARSSMA
jgi:hypothetical protein